MFTREELEKQASEPRKLKAVTKRRPTASLSRAELVHLAAKRSGFQETNVKDIVDAVFEVIYEKILAGTSIVIPRVGVLHPMIKPARDGQLFQRYNTTKTPSRFVYPPCFDLKFAKNKVFREKLKDMKISKKDIDSLYQ
jgi:nucleoid DNA-binding protein